VPCSLSQSEALQSESSRVRTFALPFFHRPIDFRYLWRVGGTTPDCSLVPLFSRLVLIPRDADYAIKVEKCGEQDISPPNRQPNWHCDSISLVSVRIKFLITLTWAN
jgi:hypothetical protein